MGKYVSVYNLQRQICNFSGDMFHPAIHRISAEKSTAAVQPYNYV